jgi:hypothetical protein
MSARPIKNADFLRTPLAACYLGKSEGLRDAWRLACESRAPHAMRRGLRRKMRFWSECMMGEVRAYVTGRISA